MLGNEGLEGYGKVNSPCSLEECQYAVFVNSRKRTCMKQTLSSLIFSSTSCASPRPGLPSLEGKQWILSESASVGSFREASASETRALQWSSVSPRTKQIICDIVGLPRRTSNICAPSEPVAPVRTTN